jgi:hypothetical protein
MPGKGVKSHETPSHQEGKQGQEDSVVLVVYWPLRKPPRGLKQISIPFFAGEKIRDLKLTSPSIAYMFEETKKNSYLECIFINSHSWPRFHLSSCSHPLAHFQHLQDLTTKKPRAIAL